MHPVAAWGAYSVAAGDRIISVILDVDVGVCFSGTNSWARGENLVEGRVMGSLAKLLDVLATWGTYAAASGDKNRLI